MRDDIRRVRKYELMAIFVPELPEDELQAAVTRVSDILTGAGGSVSIINREAPWGRRRLAYPIRHASRDVRDGFYVLYYAELDSQSVADVERDLKLTDNLMRYLITQQVAEAMIPQSEADEAEERAAAEAVAAGIVPGGMVTAPATSDATAAEVGGTAEAPAATGEASEPTAPAGDTGTASPAADVAPEPEPKPESEPEPEVVQTEEPAEAETAETAEAETIEAETAEVVEPEPTTSGDEADSGAVSDPVESADAGEAAPVEVGEDAEGGDKE